MIGVKVCGLTRPDDVAIAVSLGASHVGFNCSRRSPRRADLSRAEDLARRAGEATRVGVFVDEPPGEVDRAIEALGLQLLQFHRELRASDFGHGVPVVAVARVSEGGARLPDAALLSRCRALLFDTADPESPGGTGRPFDWSAIGALALPVPLWLAGGLRPDNVAEAIARTRPELVDVASGVESSPGVKDPAKLEAFLLAARSS